MNRAVAKFEEIDHWDDKWVQEQVKCIIDMVPPANSKLNSFFAINEFAEYNYATKILRYK